jgi:hypothetical protein
MEGWFSTDRAACRAPQLSLQLGAAVDVLEPASLRREIAAEHAAAAKRAYRSTRQESLTFDDSDVKETGGR